MAQIITRVTPELLHEVDQLVQNGVVESRSDAVRLGLLDLIERTRRRAVGQAIVEGYTRMPQTDDEVGWSDRSTAAMIAEEPW